MICRRFVLSALLVVLGLATAVLAQAPRGVAPPAGPKPPGGPASDVELVVDPYFPKTIPTVPPELTGLAAHSRGRNRLMLDGHAEFVRDARLK